MRASADSLGDVIRTCAARASMANLAPERWGAARARATASHRESSGWAGGLRRAGVVRATGMRRGFVLLCVLMLGGCGLSAAQRGAAAKFGAAAADLGTIAAEEFRRSRLDVIAMNTKRLGLGDESVDASRLDGSFGVEDVAVRVDAALALREYGVVLAALAGGAESAELGAATDRLVGSLSRLRDAARLEVSDERLGAIGRAVSGVGGLAVEAERARALREVSEAAGPAVRRVVELIRRDVDPEEDHWQLGYLAACARLDEVVKNTRAERGSGGRDEQVARAAMVSLLAEAEALSARSAGRMAEVRPRIAAAAAAVLAAEEDLRASLLGGAVRLDDVEALSEKVAELIRVYRVLRE